MLVHLEALTLLDDRTLALRRFAVFEKRLSQELSAEPGSALKNWASRSRRGSAESRHHAISPPSRIAEATVLPTPMPLFGRQSEFSQLWRLWENTQQGRGAILVLEGPAGIGKTSLLTKLANQVHVSGGSVCLTRCYRTERSVPFAPVTALIRQLSRLPGFIATDPVWIGELTRLVPELRERYPSIPMPMAVDDAARHRLSDATVQACIAVADEQAVLVAVDDIQEADEATLAVLHYLTRQLSNHPIGILLALRNREAVSSLQKSFLDAVRKLDWSVVLELKALPEFDMERLVQHTLATMGHHGGSSLVGNIVARTNGNPLQAIEAAVAFSENEIGLNNADPSSSVTLGEGFDETALNRLTRLEPSSLLVAASVVVAGRPLTQYELSVVTQLPMAELARALGILESQHFLRGIGDAFALSHDLYASTIETRASVSLRTELHYRFAELLARSASDNPAARYDVARHYAAAQQPALAREQALEAARHAKSLGATRERALALELAMSVATSFEPQLGINLVYCLLQLREHGKVQAICDTADNESLSSKESGSFEFARIASAHLLGALSASATRERLERLLERCPDFELASAARTMLMRVATRLADHDLMRHTSKALRRSLHKETTDWPSLSYLALGYTAAKYYWPHRALPLMRRALVAATNTHDLETEHLCRTGLCAVNRQLGLFKASVLEMELALALARRTLNPQLEASDLTDMAVAEFAMGDYHQSEGHFTEALHILDSFPEPSTEVFTRSNYGEMLLLANRMEAACIQFETAQDIAENLQLIPNLIQCCAGMALRAQALGRTSLISENCERIRRLGSGRERRYHDRWMTEAAFAWETALCRGGPAKALENLQSASLELYRRDVDHWLLVECESLRIQRTFNAEVNEQQFAVLVAKAKELGARGVLQRLGADQTD